MSIGIFYWLLNIFEANQQDYYITVKYYTQKGCKNVFQVLFDHNAIIYS